MLKLPPHYTNKEETPTYFGKKCDGVQLFLFLCRLKDRKQFENSSKLKD